MASIVKRGNRYRALIRKNGHKRCETFGSRAAAKEWAARIESEIEELRASGIMDPRDTTVGELIERYIEEFQAQKKWGRSKSADLSWLKRKLGDILAGELTGHKITTTFQTARKEGAGVVTVSGRIGYLVGVLETARNLWHLEVPLKAAQDARSALSKAGLIGKSQRRDRRVSDTEIAQVIDYFEKHETQLPYPELIRFCLATGMRISEVCRLEWRDLNAADKTIIIRDRKHPTDKIGNDMTVPLLNATGFDAFEIVQRQPRSGKRIFPYNAHTISTVFPRALAQLEIEDLHLHDLRHEAISRLFEAGYRIEQVALVSGHRDWSMLKRYTHVRAKDLHRAAA